jgi:hypothetical protein
MNELGGWEKQLPFILEVGSVRIYHGKKIKEEKDG